MARTLRVAGLAAVLGLAGAASACEVGELSRSVERGGERVCEPGSFRPLGSMRVAYAAVVRDRAVAFRRPGQDRLATFGRLNVNGVPTVFGIRGTVVDRRCRVSWYRVQLPLRPNGVVGYVRASAVGVGRVRTRIVVDLSSREVTLFQNGRATIRTRAAIGSSATPTPTGTFYVNQRLIPNDPSGPFGPGAIGISAFSNVLTGWTQGGPIAIHGTNQPSSIGRSVSNGCIRVPNDVLRRMFQAALAGTPVLVRR
jgi:lipoprotein-anchoring transpeptidase ErfK/SrfK